MLIETCLTCARIIVLSLCFWIYLTIIEMIIVAILNKADLSKKTYIITGFICAFLAAKLYCPENQEPIASFVGFTLGFFLLIMFMGFNTYGVISRSVKDSGVSFSDYLFAFIFSIIISIIVIWLFDIQDILFDNVNNINFIRKLK